MEKWGEFWLDSSLASECNIWKETPNLKNTKLHILIQHMSSFKGDTGEYEVYKWATIEKIISYIVEKREATTLNDHPTLSIEIKCQELDITQVCEYWAAISMMVENLWIQLKTHTRALRICLCETLEQMRDSTDVNRFKAASAPNKFFANDLSSR